MRNNNCLWLAKRRENLINYYGQLDLKSLPDSYSSVGSQTGLTSVTDDQENNGRVTSVIAHSRASSSEMFNDPYYTCHLFKRDV